MKVLYITEGVYNSGGVERVLSLKLNYLAREVGYEVILVTMNQKGRESFYELDEKVKRYDIGLNFEDSVGNIFSETFLYFRRNLLYRRGWKHIVEIVQKESPDVCVSLGGIEMKYFSKRDFECKTVYEHHFTQNYIYYLQRSLHGRIIGGIIGKILTKQVISRSKSFNRVVVLTKEDKQIWEKTNDSISQIYNPLSFESGEVSSLESKNLITVGRLSAQKNYESLIKAWQIVQSKHPDWTMNVWGGGELKERLQGLIQKYEVQKTFLLRGVTKNIRKEYLRSSAYVMSSLYEGFPMVLLEAASSGLPLISYACQCGPREIIEEGKNGFLVPVNDEIGLAVAICKIIEDYELRKEMGRQSKVKSYDFSAAKILPQWPRFFEMLVKGQC